MLMFFGLHSSLIHFVSSLSWSSPELSSTTYLSMFFAIRIPTPPPSFSFLFFPIHLYPFIFTFCFSFSLVSVISAIWIFSDSSSDSRLFIFSCDQAALQMVFSVCPSVCPSVCHTFLTMFPSSYHHDIFRSYYQ